MDHKTLYRSLYLCRRADELVSEAVINGEARNPVHLSIGQEFVSVGACAALEDKDVVFGTYRGHALYLARGGSVKKMVAEIYGKQSGCAGGKGGSMHLIDPDVNFMGTSGIVGTGLPNAVGYAYGMRLQRKDGIVLCVFGDGAVDEGVFYESINFASLKKLNIIFLCENNSYAIRSHQSCRQSACNIYEKASLFKIDSRLIKSSTIDVYKAISSTRKDMMRNPGPRFFECHTCRWKEHLGPNNDHNMNYRPPSVVENSMKNDELLLVAALLSPQEVETIKNEVNQKLEEAFDDARKDSFPEISEIDSQVFAR